jgi:hypothetical protein
MWAVDSGIELPADRDAVPAGNGFVVVDTTPDIERLDELALVVEKVDWPILPSSLTPYGSAVTKIACATD